MSQYQTYTIHAADKNASLEDYRESIKFDNHRISGVFNTIQGEGPFAGTPAVFVRTAGCNRGEKVGRGCDFCDTDFRLDASKLLSSTQLQDEILSQSDSVRSAILVITGGEPLLQLHTIVACCRVWERAYRQLNTDTLDASTLVQVETNGDMLPQLFKHFEEVFDDYYHGRLVFVVSPKITPAGTADFLSKRARVIIDSYNELLSRYPRLGQQLFVVFKYLVHHDRSGEFGVYNYYPDSFQKLVEDIYDAFGKPRRVDWPLVYLSPIFGNRNGRYTNEHTYVKPWDGLYSSDGSKRPDIDNVATMNHYDVTDYQASALCAARLAAYCLSPVRVSLQMHKFMGIS